MTTYAVEATNLVRRIQQNVETLTGDLATIRLSRLDTCDMADLDDVLDHLLEVRDEISRIANISNR